jgi:hypothetical protein
MVINQKNPFALPAIFFWGLIMLMFVSIAFSLPNTTPETYSIGYNLSMIFLIFGPVIVDLLDLHFLKSNK